MSTDTQPWPAPHADHGKAFDKDMVAARFGWSSSAIDVAILRTRQGRARVPFPDPDGRAVKPEPETRRPGQRRRQPEPFWWSTTVEAYAQARASTAGGVRVNEGMVTRIRRRIAEGVEVDTIAAEFSVRPSDVRALALSGKRPTVRGGRR